MSFIFDESGGESLSLLRPAQDAQPCDPRNSPHPTKGVGSLALKPPLARHRIIHNVRDAVEASKAGEVVMSYSATMVLPCKACGAECHLIIECDDDPKDLRTVPIMCCRCSTKIGQLAAISVRTHPTARDALSDWLSGHKALPQCRQTDSTTGDGKC
jgi:hypothetical protein